MKQVINADPHGRVTWQGYDPVAFHAIGGAMRGIRPYYWYMAATSTSFPPKKTRNC